MRLGWAHNTYKMLKPFSITGYTFHDSEVIEVSISDGHFSGKGEAVGTYYLNETVDSMIADLRAIEPEIRDGLTIDDLQQLLPPSGARNALDCAFWDYLCKSQNKTIWDLVRCHPKVLTTVFTIGISTAQSMAQDAAKAGKYPNLKIKLSNENPIQKLEAIRAHRPDANLIIDVNQGWTFAELKEYVPHCKRLNIAMIEQPLPRGEDDELEGYQSEVPLGADESCLHMGEFEQAARRYDVVNIKLDKCGGLSEGLKIVEAARRRNMGVMVGNMMGSSLSMAPSYVIGQYCQFVDIDGPLLLAEDINNGLSYLDGGKVALPESVLWG